MREPTSCRNVVSMRAPWLTIFAVGLCLALLGAEAHGATPVSVGKSIDALFSRWDRDDAPGCTVGVMKDGKLVFARGYGMANLEYDIPNSPTSVFHIASISKQFTAFAILLLAEEDKLSLDDDIRLHLPETPDFGVPIRIRHLIHHTSGLRDQWDLLAMSGFRPDDIKTNGDILDLVKKQRELNFEPGERHLYSNTGYTLLALIVERITGSSLREFTQERIFEPLGMEHTHYQDDYNRLVKNRSYGMTRIKLRGYRRNIPAFDTVGATGLFTTVEDMARWNRNFDTMEVGGAGAFKRMLERGRLNNGEQLDYACGIAYGDYKGLRTIGHGGADAAYRSNFERYSEIGLAVVVLANTPMNTAILGRRVAGIFLEEDFRKAPAKTDSQEAEESPSDDKAGEAPEGQEANAAATLQPFNPTPEYLESFVGTYFSPELETSYRFVYSSRELLLQRRKFEDVVLRPRQEDLFAAGAFTLGFDRDAAGAITAFRLSTGRVLNLRFDKVNTDR